LENEYQPKRSTALLLGVKAGTAYSTCDETCGWQVNWVIPQQSRIKAGNLPSNETVITTNHNNPPVIHDSQFKQCH